MGLLCYKHSWLTFPALEIDKIFLIFIKRYFCCTIIPLLTILVRSSWLDMSLVLFFSVSVTSSRWPHVWSITHIFMTRTSKWCVELMQCTETDIKERVRVTLLMLWVRRQDGRNHMKKISVSFQRKQPKNIAIVETLRGHSNFHIVEINIHCLKTEHL